MRMPPRPRSVAVSTEVGRGALTGRERNRPGPCSSQPRQHQRPPSALLVAHAAMVPRRSRLSVLRCISILLGPALVHSEERHDILPPESFSEGERKKFPYDRGGRCGQFDRSPELNRKSEVLLAELHLESGTEIALQRIGEPLGEVVRSAAAYRQGVIESLGLDARRNAKRECLRGNENVAHRHHVVHDLDDLRCPDVAGITVCLAKV